MKTDYEMVREFHEVYDMNRSDTPQMITEERWDLRIALIEEEANELFDAYLKKDLVGIADALGDLVYVIQGTAVEFGIPLDKVLREIHRSNLTKLDENGNPIYREDGKILKGPNFEQPEIREILWSKGDE